MPRWLAAASVTGLMALAAAGAASAQPPQDQCSPAAMMRAHASAMTRMADYLDSRPDVAQVFADARNRATPQERHDAIRAYTDAHPDVAAVVRDIHQPIRDLRTACGLPAGPGTHAGMHPGMGFGPMGAG